MGGGKCLFEQAMLVGEWWHGRPMAVHVGNVVCAKGVQVTRSKNCGIADFCCVLWSWWQCAEQSVQRFKKSGRLHAPALKLENERTKFKSQALLCRRPDQVSKRAGIKKSWVGFPGFGSVAGKIRKGRDGDLFLDLGTEAEIFRDLPRIVRELCCTGRTIERMVDADGAKERDAIHLVAGIFCQRVLAESALRIGPLVDQSLPALIGPGASAESNVAKVAGHEKVIIQNSSLRTIG